MPGPVRLGVIGAGRWGRNVIRTIMETDGMVLTHVGSANPETRALVGQDCLISEDWHKVLDGAIDGAIDGVVITTPPALHAQMVREAVDKGIPVLVEKPLTMDLAEAESLNDLSGLILVDHIHLFAPAFQTIAHLLAAVGPVRAIRGTAGNHGPFRNDVSVLWDWGPHDVSMCLALMGGRPDRVAAKRLAQDTNGEVLSLTLIFKGGVEAEIITGNIMPEKARRFTVHTDKVVLVYDDLAPNKLTLHQPTEGFADPDGPGEPMDIPADSPLTVALTTFCDAILNHEQTSDSLDLGVDVVAVLSECETALG